MQLRAVENYLHEAQRTPYFLFVSHENFHEARTALGDMGLMEVGLNACCKGADSLPFLADISAYLKEKLAKGSRILFLGLGEYLALRGEQEAKCTLRKLKDLPCGKGAVVFLLRDVFSFAAIFAKDPRMMRGERRMAQRQGAEAKLSVTVFLPNLSEKGSLEGVRSLLATLAKGAAGSLRVRTRQQFPLAMMKVRQIATAHDAICLHWKDFSVPKEYGTEAEWQRLFDALSNAGNFSDVLAEEELARPLSADFHRRVCAGGFRRWLYFIALKQEKRLAGSYLSFVLETARADTLLQTFISRIADVPLSDERFSAFYAERKAFLKDFTDAELSEFVRRNRREPAERIYRLTDATRVEREDIIAALSAGMEKGASREKEAFQRYPALADYARDYVFREGKYAAVLTAYFKAYKRQKLANRIEPDFLHKVDELAKQRDYYTPPPMRDSLLDNVSKEGTLLFWVDALGAEFLSLIAACAERLNLQLHVQAARAILPTITKINRDFYDNWDGAKEKEERLDQLKHKESGRYNDTEREYPIHLAQEIAIVEEVMDRIARLLQEGVTRVVLTSDHGASRLAVLHEQNEYYEVVDSRGKPVARGEHAGRCACIEQGDSCDLPVVKKGDNNGYLVLADYGRFRGSRRANVEVHGGATLEEIIVPFITVTPRTGSLPKVSLVPSMPPAFDRKEGVSIVLFTDRHVMDRMLSVQYQGAYYMAVRQDDDQHFLVNIPAIHSSGTYEIIVYYGETRLQKLSFKVVGRGMQMNEAFDFP